MAELAATTEQILVSLQRIIDGEEKLAPSTDDIRSEIEIKDVPEQPVLLIRDRRPLEEMSSVVPAAIGEVHAQLEAMGAAIAGPPLVVCPYADDEGMVDIEVGWHGDRVSAGDLLDRPRGSEDPADWVTEIQFPIARDEARIARLEVARA